MTPAIATTEERIEQVLSVIRELIRQARIELNQELDELIEEVSQ